MLATSGFNPDHRSSVLQPTRALAPMADEQFSSVADPPCTCGAVRLRCGFMPVSQVCIIFYYSIAGFPAARACSSRARYGAWVT